MLFESQKCSIIIRFFSLLVINVINYDTQGYDVKLIVNYCQLSSKATPMGHLVYTVESSLLSEHMGRYCSHHQEPKVWISEIHQIPLQQDPTESLSPLLEKAEHDMIAQAFKYTWDQNNYSQAFGEGKVIPGGITVAGQSEAPRSQPQPYRSRGGQVSCGLTGCRLSPWETVNQFREACIQSQHTNPLLVMDPPQRPYMGDICILCGIYVSFLSKGRPDLPLLWEVCQNTGF